MSVVLRNEPCLIPLIFRCLIKKSDHVRPTYDLLRLRVFCREYKKVVWLGLYHTLVFSEWMLCPPYDTNIILSTSWRLSCPSLSNQNDLKIHFPSRRLDVVNRTKFYIIPRDCANILKVSNKRHYIPSYSYHSLRMMTMVGFVTNIESKCRLHHCCELQIVVWCKWISIYLIGLIAFSGRFVFLLFETQLTM